MLAITNFCRREIVRKSADGRSLRSAAASHRQLATRRGAHAGIRSEPQSGQVQQRI